MFLASQTWETFLPDLDFIRVNFNESSIISMSNC